MTPEAETQKTRMGCNTSKCDCNFRDRISPKGPSRATIWATGSTLRFHMESDVNHLSHRGSTLGGIQGPEVVQEKEGPKESLQRKSSVGLLACPDTGTRHASEHRSSLGTTGGFHPRPTTCPICTAAPAQQQPPQLQPQF